MAERITLTPSRDISLTFFDTADEWDNKELIPNGEVYLCGDDFALRHHYFQLVVDTTVEEIPNYDWSTLIKWVVDSMYTHLNGHSLRDNRDFINTAYSTDDGINTPRLKVLPVAGLIDDNQQIVFKHENHAWIGVKPGLCVKLTPLEPVVPSTRTGRAFMSYRSVYDITAYEDFTIPSGKNKLRCRMHHLPPACSISADLDTIRSHVTAVWEADMAILG